MQNENPIQPPPLATAPPVPPPGWQPSTARPRTAKAAARPEGVAISSDLAAFLERAAKRADAFRLEMAPHLDAAPQSTACQIHPETSLALDREKSMVETWQQEGGIRLKYAACELCEAEEKARAVRRYWTRRGVPDRLVDATFASFAVDTTARAEASKKTAAYVWQARQPLNPREDTSRLRGGFLLLLGPVGTGKTHLAVAAMKAFNVGGLFTTLPDLVGDLRATYGIAGATADFLERLKTAPFLTVDEWISFSLGESETAFLYQIFAHRHDKRLPTAITTNEEAKELKEGLGFRLVDRIKEDCVFVNFHGESFRNSNK